MYRVISNSDLHHMQTMGRLVATHDDRQAFESAAEYLAVSRLEGSNFTRLWLWFEEGARNYVDGQYHLVGIQKRLKERAEEIYQANLPEHKHKLHIYGDRYRCSICGGNTFTEADF
jgi:hypothetical protein